MTHLYGETLLTYVVTAPSVSHTSTILGIVLFQLWDITVAMGYLHTMDPFIGHYCLCPSVIQVSNPLLHYNILK